MRRPDPFAHPGPEYEAFLFAPLGNDRNGAPLAVASILGRLSLDPWLEAAAMAALPVEVATQKLASYLESALSGAPLKHPESTTLAARLVKLLPAPTKSSVAGPIAAMGVTLTRKPANYVMWLAIFCVLLLAATFAHGTAPAGLHDVAQTGGENAALDWR